jgi:hypothetical protein
MAGLSLRRNGFDFGARGLSALTFRLPDSPGRPVAVAETTG